MCPLSKRCRHAQLLPAEVAEVGVLLRPSLGQTSNMLPAETRAQTLHHSPSQQSKSYPICRGDAGGALGLGQQLSLHSFSVLPAQVALGTLTAKWMV